jgi:hypothetical protein
MKSKKVLSVTRIKFVDAAEKVKVGAAAVSG